MKYFLFHDNGSKYDPDYIGVFKTKAAALKYIKSDIIMLKKEYPNEDWSVKDYLIARRVK